ncbi:hypothetical protein PA7_07700 [Pseudonocardia asaccharolytica DSM 44247 = NBRC 16224]|uniref:Uncharacterized protein n=1 Tax=Pseudonocardia asaccharolytica DSM 44247 = NBRC 16224 TaxID=1123024 RepID=A0A511CXE2_9PSEU|nr:hypothetical protein PA7_07700 [Pseudonocardia asaccharolytica DSM 44247 = NBRC 16224]
MGVAHLDGELVQRGDVALEVWMTAGADQPAVDSAKLRDDSSEPRDVRCVRTYSGRARSVLEYVHLPLERHSLARGTPVRRPFHARPTIRLSGPV